MFQPTEDLVDLAIAAERAGFTGAILSDHLVTFREQTEDYPAREDGKVFWGDQTHWPDSWVTMATLAQATSTLRFTTAVYVLPLRDPFSVAKSLSTLAVMSGNRVALGAGIGWQQAEFNLTGQSFSQRGRRADEALAIISKLTTGATVDHNSEFYQFPPLCMTPAPTRPIPILIGGESDAALYRAARHDGWIGLQYTRPQLQKVLQRLQQARDETGSHGDFEIIIGSAEDPSQQLFSELEHLGVTGVMTSSWPLQADLHSDLSLEEKLRCIASFGERFID